VRGLADEALYTLRDLRLNVFGVVKTPG